MYTDLKPLSEECGTAGTAGIRAIATVAIQLVELLVNILCHTALVKMISNSCKSWSDQVPTIPNL